MMVWNRGNQEFECLTDYSPEFALDRSWSADQKTLSNSRNS